MFSKAEIAADPILQYFKFDHLPPHLQDHSRSFAILANKIITTVPRNAERSVALRKLLEAKDAAVRAGLTEPENKRADLTEPEPVKKEIVRYRDPVTMEFVEKEIIRNDLGVDGPPDFR